MRRTFIFFLIVAAVMLIPLVEGQRTEGQVSSAPWSNEEFKELWSEYERACDSISSLILKAEDSPLFPPGRFQIVPTGGGGFAVLNTRTGGVALLDQDGALNGVRDISEDISEKLDCMSSNKVDS